MLTVYTTSTCAFCPMVKKYLTLKNLPFKEVNVTDDQETRGELFAKTGMMTVPVVTDGKEFVVGYQPALLAKFVR